MQHKFFHDDAEHDDAETDGTTPVSTPSPGHKRKLTDSQEKSGICAGISPEEPKEFNEDKAESEGKGEIEEAFSKQLLDSPRTPKNRKLHSSFSQHVSPILEVVEKQPLMPDQIETLVAVAGQDFIPLPVSLNQTNNITLMNQAICLRMIDTSETHTQYYKQLGKLDDKLYKPGTNEPLNFNFDYVIIWDKQNQTLQLRIRMNFHFYLALPEDVLLERIQAYKNEHPEIVTMTIKDYKMISINDLASKDGLLIVVAGGVLFFKEGTLTAITTKSGCFHPTNKEEMLSARKAIRSFPFLKNVELIEDLDIAKQLEELAASAKKSIFANR